MAVTKDEYYGDQDKRPQTARVNTAAIPAVLLFYPQLIGWRYEWKKDKWAKVPKNPHTLFVHGASSTAPLTWAGYDDICELAKRAVNYGESRKPDGLGFVFRKARPPELQIIGLDLDKCRNPDTGELTPLATEVVARFATYTEVSPSGTGVKAFGFAQFPAGWEERDGPKNKVSLPDGQDIEVYDSGRYFVVTGNRVPDTPDDVADCQDKLDWLLETYFKPTKQLGAKAGRRRPDVDAEPALGTSDLTDEQVIEFVTVKSKQAAKGLALWNGDLSPKGGDWSACDAALCNLIAFYTGPDPTRIDRIFSQSGLAQRSKWTERGDYRAKTIGFALSNRESFYESKRKRGRNKVTFGTAGGLPPSGPPTDEPPADEPPTREQILSRCRAHVRWTPGGRGDPDKIRCTAAELAREIAHGFGLADDEGFGFFVIWNRSCSPPLADDVLREVWEAAVAAGPPAGKEAGWLLRDPEPAAKAPPPNEATAHTDPEFPSPVSGELWDDPNRFARLMAAAHQLQDGTPTLIQWRDDYHQWGGDFWSVYADSDLTAAITRHTRRVIQADFPTRRALWEGKGKEPALFKVSKELISDVTLNLSALRNHPDSGVDAPFWMYDGAGRPDPAGVIAAPNGLFTLDEIAAGRPAFSQPTPLFFTPNALPFAVPTAPPPPAVWLRCLAEWFSGDAASIAGLQEWFGYLLTADTSTHKILMLIGPPRSGKGSIIHALGGLVGWANVASTSFAALGESFGLEDLIGKRVAIIPDGRLSGRTDVGAVVERLLSVSGEDPQTVNRKNRPRITTRLRCRFLLATNEMPRLPDASGAMATRFHILQTPNSWVGKEDRDLKAKLAAEMPGILLWAAKGWARLKANGMRFTPNAAADEYRRQMADLSSPIKAFVRECCTVGPDQEVEIPNLYRAWREWNGERNREVSSEGIFGRDIRAALPQVRDGQRRDGVRRVRIYYGVGLKDKSEWGDDDLLARDGTRAEPTHAWATSTPHHSHPGNRQANEKRESQGCVGSARVPSRASDTPRGTDAEASEWV